MRGRCSDAPRMQAGVSGAGRDYHGHNDGRFDLRRRHPLPPDTRNQSRCRNREPSRPLQWPKGTSVEEREWERLYLPADEDDFGDKLLDTPGIPMLVDSPHVTRRIAAQRSRFMIFGTDPLWLSNLLGRKDSHLESISIADLDGLGRELKQMWETRR